MGTWVRAIELRCPACRVGAKAPEAAAPGRIRCRGRLDAVNWRYL